MYLCVDIQAVTNLQQIIVLQLVNVLLNFEKGQSRLETQNEKRNIKRQVTQHKGTKMYSQKNKDELR